MPNRASDAIDADEASRYFGADGTPEPVSAQTRPETTPRSEVTWGATAGGAFATSDVKNIGESGFEASIWGLYRATSPVGLGLEAQFLYTSSDITVRGLTAQGGGGIDQSGTAWSTGVIAGRFGGSPGLARGLTVGAGLIRSGTDISASAPNTVLTNDEDFESRDWGFYISHRYAIQSNFGAWKSVRISLGLRVRHAFLGGETQHWVVPSAGTVFTGP